MASVGWADSGLSQSATLGATPNLTPGRHTASEAATATESTCTKDAEGSTSASDSFTVTRDWRMVSAPWFHPAALKSQAAKQASRSLGWDSQV